MAVNIAQSAGRSDLQKAVKYAYEQGSRAREKRNNLIAIHNDDANSSGPNVPAGGKERSSFMNYFQAFVRGHVLSLSYRLPRWKVSARQTGGRGFDTRIQMFLNYYFEKLGFAEVLRQLAVDTAFGDAIVKVVEGPPPQGIESPLAPRCYRVNSNDFIADYSAENIATAGFLADTYLVPLDEARAYYPAHADRLQHYRFNATDSREVVNDWQAYPQDMTRLIDVYIPTQGAIYTYPAHSDAFEELNDDPINVVQTPINPYCVCKLMLRPDSTEEISRLWSLREAHFLANDMWHKMARQARQQKRHPLAGLGEDKDLDTVINAQDGEPVLVNDPSKLGVYAFPGADAGTSGAGTLAAQLFSEQAGNLNVALGVNPGAKTARQTQALLGQIGSVQDYDRGLFESFISEVGRKVATLAFLSETLEVEMRATVPGTRLEYPVSWAPPAYLPRVGTIDDYAFEVAPFSTAYRSPSERLGQLQEASQGILQWMMASAQGAPINLAAVMASFQEAYDLVELEDWWSGEKPSPQEKTANTYTSMAQGPQGSEVNYNGVGDGGGGQDNFQLPLNAPPVGAIFGGM